jgi:hypothetical protein
MVRPKPSSQVVSNIRQSSLSESVVPNIRQSSLSESVVPNIRQSSLSESVVSNIRQSSLSESVVPNIRQSSLSESVNLKIIERKDLVVSEKKGMPSDSSQLSQPTDALTEACSKLPELVRLKKELEERLVTVSKQIKDLQEVINKELQ